MLGSGGAPAGAGVGMDPFGGAIDAASVLKKSLNLLMYLCSSDSEVLLLSIFVMYSNDREAAFLQMLEFLEAMPLYADAQKTLVVDGCAERVFPGWETIQVPRLSGRFCWGRMWDAGVLSARNETVVYLDSDRLLPSCFLEKVQEHMAENTFVFTSNHYLMHKVLPTSLCKEFLEGSDDSYFTDQRFVGALQYDPRFRDPVHGPGKNVMSGSTAFTRQTYLRMGGVDHWYCGHGAYADTDFHYQVAQSGCRFIDLWLKELHYPHAKNDITGKALQNDKLKLLALDNLIYYCDKWQLSPAFAANVAMKSKVTSPNKYVAERQKLLRESPDHRFE